MHSVSDKKNGAPDMNAPFFIYLLQLDIEDYLPAIVLRADCEMHPHPRAPYLDNKLIEVFSRFICYIEENNGTT